MGKKKGRFEKERGGTVDLIFRWRVHKEGREDGQCIPNHRRESDYVGTDTPETSHHEGHAGSKAESIIQSAFSPPLPLMQHYRVQDAHSFERSNSAAQA